MPFSPAVPFKALAAPLAGSASRSRRMAAASAASAADSGIFSEYPMPLTPPYPAVSKEMELARAMTAAARSGAFELTVGDVVFEDESMVAVNKPSGIYCETLLKALACQALSPAGDGIAQSNLHLANRLDRDTSGLMVITKSHKVAAKLVKAFTDHMVKKTYIALCVGQVPKWDKITISSGHGRSKFGAFRVYAASDVGRTLPGGSLVKHMTTSFELLSVNGCGEFRESKEPEMNKVKSVVVEGKAAEISSDDGENRDQILLRAYPQSGRTHQIRLHCQYLGIPIKGDVKYGGVIEWKEMTCDFHCLHAESLSFNHPVSGLPVYFHPPLPFWARELSGARSLS